MWFLIMVSRVGRRQSFRVKTLVGRHKCGRVFGNKNANKDWIAQVLIYKFMNVGIMTVAQIIDEVKKTYRHNTMEGWESKTYCNGLFGGGWTTTIWSFI